MPNVANVSNSDELGLSAGKNSLLKMPANRPKTVKSNHSSALPIVEEITTRRRICAMASVCICSSLLYRRRLAPPSLLFCVADPMAKVRRTTTGSFRFRDAVVQQTTVIPGRAEREPGIHNHDREYGF